MQSKLRIAMTAATAIAGIAACAGTASAYVTSRVLGPNDWQRIADGPVTPPGATLFAQVETTTFTSRIVTVPANSGPHKAWLTWQCSDGTNDGNDEEFGPAGGEIRGNCGTGTTLTAAVGAVDDYD